MPDNARAMIETAMSRLCQWLNEYDYAIANESELCGLFLHHLIVAFEDKGISPRDIRSEVKFRETTRDYRTKIAASIDFGIGFPSKESDTTMRGFLEAKAWIRPTHLKGLAKNSCTQKRKQCLADAKRLLDLSHISKSKFNGLLIYEQGSTHLRRLVPAELEKIGIAATPIWADIGRPSMGRRKEHLGLIWVANAYAA